MNDSPELSFTRCRRSDVLEFHPEIHAYIFGDIYLSIDQSIYVSINLPIYK